MPAQGMNDAKHDQAVEARRRIAREKPASQSTLLSRNSAERTSDTVPLGGTKD